MAKEAVSVTIGAENLLWLRGQVRASGRRSISEVLDGLVSEARASGRVHQTTIRSVVGTVSIAAHDPDLTHVDSAVRALFPQPAARRFTRKRLGSRPKRRRRG